MEFCLGITKLYNKTIAMDSFLFPFPLSILSLDIDECNLSEKVCTKENEDCVNTSGSYKCVCSEGFEDKGGTCVQTVKTGKWLFNDRYLNICVYIYI